MEIVKQARDNRDSTVGQNKKKRKYLHCNPHYCVRFAVLAVVEFSFKKQQKLAKLPAGSSYIRTSIEKLARFGYKIAELLLRTHHRQFLFCQLSRFHFCSCFCCFCCLKKQLIDWVVPLFTFSTFLIWFWQAEIFSARKKHGHGHGFAFWRLDGAHILFNFIKSVKNARPTHTDLLKNL